jgi:hypothetical protein
MRRFAGALLAGLGGLCLAAAVGVLLFVAPSVTKLPYNSQPCPKPPAAQPSGCIAPSVVIARGAQILVVNESGANVVTTNVRTTVEVVPQVKLTADQQDAGKLDDDAVIWAVYTTVVDADTGAPINKSSTELAMDRVSGEAVNWGGQWIEDQSTPIRYTDQVYKFPFGTEQRDYKIYDSTLLKASVAKFKGVEEIDGLTVYHFVQDIPDTNAVVADSDVKALVATFAPEAKSGVVSYRNTREVWVDPVTGVYAKVRERPHQELRADNGKVQVLLDADFQYTPESMANSVKTAKDNGAMLKLINVYAPLGLGVLGLVFVVIGILLLRSPRAAAATATVAGPDDEAARWEESLPEARHKLREDAT